jgi:transcriptional regulator with XRE-family HTH domain
MGARRNRRPSSLFSPGYDRLMVALTKMREDAGLTQQDLADRMKKHRSFIWKTEGRQQRLDLFEFIRWCEGCGADPLDVFRTVLQRESGGK